MPFNLGQAFQQYPSEIIVSIIIVLVSFRILPLVYCIICFYFSSRPISKSKLHNSVNGKHVIISGASAGLGLSTAFILAKAGAKLTLIARGTDNDSNGKSRLDHAVESCQNLINDNDSKSMNERREKYKRDFTPFVGSIACDVADYHKLVNAIEKAVSERGPIDWIIANAGAAIPGFAMDQLPQQSQTSSDNDVKKTNTNNSLHNKSELEYMLNVNIKGPAHLIQAVLANAVRQSNSNSTVKISGIPLDVKMPERIVLVGSQISCIGFIGYTAYCASKFALRGYSDSLRSELIPFGTKVQLFLPANMNTPGFAIENKTKPIITSKIEGSIQTISADSAAAIMLGGILSNRYYLTSDLIGELIRIYTHGMAPKRPNPLAEIMSMPLLSTIFAIFTWSIDTDTIKYGEKERAKKEK